MIAALRSGNWLTQTRLCAYPLIMLAVFVSVVAFVVATAHDNMGPNNLPLGSDFSQVYVAGKETLAGDPDAPYDIRRHGAAQHAEFNSLRGIFGWHYPPYFLAPAALLARLPYLQALALWQSTTLGLYLLSIFAILRGSGLQPVSVLIGALAFPAVFVNLGHSQNAF